VHQTLNPCTKNIKMCTKRFRHSSLECSKTKLKSPKVISFRCSRIQSPSAKSVHQIILSTRRASRRFPPEPFSTLHLQVPLASLKCPEKNPLIQKGVRYCHAKWREQSCNQMLQIHVSCTAILSSAKRKLTLSCPLLSTLDITCDI
jgi:hypothetical protein